MVVEGVNFVEENVKKMKKKEFIDRHKMLFQDRAEEEREKLLSDIYDKIKGASPSAPGLLTE